MIESLKDVIKKTNELSDRLDKLERTSTTIDNNSFISIYNNNCINVHVNTHKTLTISKFDNSKNQMYFQLNINFSLSTEQEIEFYILINKGGNFSFNA